MELADGLASKQSSSNAIYPPREAAKLWGRSENEKLWKGPSSGGRPPSTIITKDRPKQEEKRAKANERWDDDECGMKWPGGRAMRASGLLWSAVSPSPSLLSLSVSLSLSPLSLSRVLAQPSSGVVSDADGK